MAVNKLRSIYYTKDLIQKAVLYKGYDWFSDDKNSINIVAIRLISESRFEPNAFTDLLTLCYKTAEFSGHSQWAYRAWPVTTAPGECYMNGHGPQSDTAVLVPGQYKNCYALGTRNGTDQSMLQVRPVRVFRAAKRNNGYNMNFVEEGLFDIDIHKSAPRSLTCVNGTIPRGCTIFQSFADFDAFMQICRAAAPMCDNKFTYTLLEADDVEMVSFDSIPSHSDVHGLMHA